MKLIPVCPAVVAYGLLVLSMLALAVAGMSNDAVLDEMQRRIALAAQTTDAARRSRAVGYRLARRPERYVAPKMEVTP